LIDIIIVINIVGILERGGYHYYVNVCLKRNYLDMYLETNFLDNNLTQEESSLNSDLLFRLKGYSNIIVNEEFMENNYDKKIRINTNYTSNKSGYFNSLIRLIHNLLNSFGNLRKKNTLNNNYYTFFQYNLTKNVINYHLPSNNNFIVSNSKKTILKLEGSK
jgi:hypothetical protein